MRILAIDPSTTSGWCALHPNCYGICDISIKKGQSEGIKWIKFRQWLSEITTNLQIEMIAVERVSGHHANGVISHAKILGVIEAFCVEHNIEYIQYSAGEIKKFATGKGTAKKPDMIEAARVRFGYQGSNDNEADAICLFKLAESQFNQ